MKHPEFYFKGKSEVTGSEFVLIYPEWVGEEDAGIKAMIVWQHNKVILFKNLLPEMAKTIEPITRQEYEDFINSENTEVEEKEAYYFDPKTNCFLITSVTPFKEVNDCYLIGASHTGFKTYVCKDVSVPKSSLVKHNREVYNQWLIGWESIDLIKEYKPFVISERYKEKKAKKAVMDTGLGLITKERKDQLKKHNRTIEADVSINSNEQLSKAASILVYNGDGCLTVEDIVEEHCPEHWDECDWEKLVSKSYEERLAVAGALIAAELDRLIYLQNIKDD